MIARITRDVCDARAGQRLNIPEDRATNEYLSVQGRAAGTDRGHILADSLGGPNLAWNFFPQPYYENRYGEWRQFEREIKGQLANANVAYVDWFAFVCHNSIDQPTTRVVTIHVEYQAMSPYGQLVECKRKAFDFDFKAKFVQKKR